jgi:hypothetical protein
MNAGERLQLASALADGIRLDATLTSAAAAKPRAIRFLEELSSVAVSSPQQAATTPGWIDRIATCLAAGAILQVGLVALAVFTVSEWPASGRVPREAQLVTMIVNGVAATLILAVGQHDPAARGLSLLLLGVSAAFANALALISPPWIPASAEHWRVVFVTLPFELALPLGAWLFIAAFPRIERGARIQRITEVVRSTVAVVVAIALVAHIVMAAGGSASWSRGLLLFDRHSVGSAYWPAYFVMLIPAVPIGAAKLRLGYVTDRRRVRLLLAALCVAFGPIVIFSVLVTASAVTANWVRGEQIFQYAGLAIFGGLWSLPFSSGAAVLAKGVLPIRVVVRRTIHRAFAKASISVAIAFPIAIVLVLLLAYPDRSVGQFLEDGGRLWMTIAAASLAMLVVRESLLRMIDRLFYRDHVDPRQLIRDIGLLSRRKLGPRNAADTVLAGVNSAFRPVTSSILIREHGGPLRQISGRSTPLRESSGLVGILEASGEPVSFDGQGIASLLPASDLQWVRENDWKIVAPLQADGEVLIGALCLGPRQSDEDYLPDDLSTIEAICSAAAPVLANRIPTQQQAAEGVAGSECVECGELSDHLADRCRCGGEMVGSMLPRRVAGRYRLQRRIGRGGMGVVYEALDEQLDRKVALKTLPEAGAQEIAQLRQEARIMAGLQHHGLAQVYGLETIGPVPVLVVEYLAGGTLADRIHRAALSEHDLAALGIQVAEALEHLHGCGILHRDLKPSNIGFATNGRAKLLDFGLAITLDRTSSATPAGTLKYVSPEVLSGQPPTELCDLWSLGVLLSEATNNPALNDVVGRALRQDAGTRFQSAQAFREALARFADLILNGE